MLFNKEHFGKPISEKISDILKRNTSSLDRVEVAATSKVAASTLTALTYRRATVTLGNFEAIIELVRRALRNAQDRKQMFSDDQDYLLETLEEPVIDIG